MKCQTVQSCLQSNHFNANQRKLKLRIEGGWSPVRKQASACVEIVTEGNNSDSEMKSAGAAFALSGCVRL